MPIELTVPQVGESITDVQIGQWLKKEGDAVREGETLVEIETDKITVELPAPSDGRLGRVVKGDGAAASVGEVIGYLEEAGAAAPSPASARATPATAAEPPPAPRPTGDGRERAPAAPAAGGPVRETGPAVSKASGQRSSEPLAVRTGAPAAEKQVFKPAESQPVSPSARPPAEAWPPSDEAALRGRKPAVPPRSVERRPEAAPPPSPALSDVAGDEREREETRRPPPRPAAGGREEQVVPMSPLRRRVAERLVQAQQTAALLTTFNEVDMSAVMTLRARHQQAFLARHHTKLGIMSFFVKAAIDALKRFPQVNAEIRGTDIVFRNYYDIGVAVSTDKGLVVPVLLNADRLSFAQIELAIADFAARARDNKLKLAELEGGTFTITNGGVFGSLLSTPIVNPPQSGILGLHAIQDRPVVRDSQVVVRPMMYVAFTYDHRVVDGREAVGFLRRIKEAIEEPARMLVEI